MRRVAPSAMVREEIAGLFTDGVDRGTNLLSALAELGVRYLAQQGLEQEQADRLGRGRYERRSSEQPGGWRNGYEDAALKTAEGEVAVRVPQVRGGQQPYRSRLMEFLDGHSEGLDRLVTEMYARGLSTRDVEDAFRDATGTRSPGAPSRRSPTSCGRTTRRSAPGTCPGSRSPTCSPTPSSVPSPVRGQGGGA